MWVAGTVIRKYRQQAELDQRDLADLLQVSQAQMSRLESGLVPLTPAQLFFLADYFDAPDILLEYVQPFLDRAISMIGASVDPPPEKFLLSLLDSALSDLQSAIDHQDKTAAATHVASMVSLAQVVRILLER